jgi:hypothetical protein
MSHHSSYSIILKIDLSFVLKVRRLRSIAIETFKIIHKESPIYLHDLVNIKKHNYSFRYENTADVPSVKTTRYGLKSFRYFSTKL